MGNSPQITYSGPVISEEVPWESRRHLQLLYQKAAGAAQGIALLKQQIESMKAGSGSTTTIVEGGGGSSSSGGGGGGTSTIASIPVNNQSGVTSYATAAGDQGTLVLFSDASPIAVSLTSQQPPWSCYIANIGSSGAGTVTLTPAAGTINGAATLALPPDYSAIVAYDGSNWWATTLPIVPVNTPAVAHEWLNSYNASTGTFTQTQPAFTDISGVASTAQIGTGTPASGSYVDGGTGAWTTLPAPLSGVTGSLGGSPMTAGQTITANVTVSGATTSMVAVCSPQTYPGNGFVWNCYVSAANTVTVTLTCVAAGTPNASVYNVRVLK